MKRKERREPGSADSRAALSTTASSWPLWRLRRKTSAPQDGGRPLAHPQDVTAGDSSSVWWQPERLRWPGPGRWSQRGSRGHVGPQRGPCGNGSANGSHVRNEFYEAQRGLHTCARSHSLLQEKRKIGASNMSKPPSTAGFSSPLRETEGLSQRVFLLARETSSMPLTYWGQDHLSGGKDHVSSPTGCGLARRVPPSQPEREALSS